MSVKFAKEVIMEATVPGGKQLLDLDISKKLDIGKTLGGGQLQPGYLAVRDTNPPFCGHRKCEKTRRMRN